MVLYAGPLQMLYEHGFLRYICYQDEEILRMIYFALRDENWGTCKHVITHEEKDISWETFRIQYESFSRKDNQDLIRWNTTIEGSPDSNVRFTIHGEVLKEISKNRAGLCILHPLEGVKGQPAAITEPDGSTYTGNFPTAVSPENPFRNIRKMKWQLGERWFELVFDGDVFETEDQRNWIDTSYKTFCTPSDLPIPVTLPAGTKIHQQVMFRPIEKLQPITSHDSILIELKKTALKTRLPRISTIIPPDSGLTLRHAGVLKRLNLGCLLAEVDTSAQEWVSRFSKQCEAAYAIGRPIKVSLTLPQDFREPLEQFTMLVQHNRLNVSEVLLLTGALPVTHQNLIDETGRLKNHIPNIKWGAGTSGDFKDINRNRFDPGAVDFISFSAHPQVHAFDDRTILENKDGLLETGKSAALIYPGKEIHISPVTLQKRSASHPDPRQQTELAALWAFGGLRAAAEAGVTAMTLYGVHDIHALLADKGTPYPAFSMIEKLSRFRGYEMIVLTNSEPLLADGMLFTSDSATTLLLVNYTDDLQTIRYGRNEFQVPPLQLLEINLSST